MYQNIKIESLDHYGRGIAHINNKVVFINNALPDEVVNIKIVNDKKSFSEAIVTKYITKSNNRIERICPYFEKCGGCNLLFYNYENTLKFKENKVKELLVKNKINYINNNSIIRSEHPLNYRNKISLKIINNKIGYYETKSHDLVEIKKCPVASESINKIIKDYKLLNIKNGYLTIRCNYNNEILLIINFIYN